MSKLINIFVVLVLPLGVQFYMLMQFLIVNCKSISGRLKMTMYVYVNLWNFYYWTCWTDWVCEVHNCSTVVAGRSLRESRWRQNGESDVRRRRRDYEDQEAETDCHWWVSWWRAGAATFTGHCVYSITYTACSTEYINTSLCMLWFFCLSFVEFLSLFYECNCWQPSDQVNQLEPSPVLVMIN